MANEEFCWEESNSGLNVVSEEFKENSLEKKVVSLDDLNLNNVRLNRVEENILYIKVCIKKILTARINFKNML